MKKIINSLLLIFILLNSSAYAIGMGDFIKVKWKGNYYDAHIIEKSDANFRIHYKGYDHSWDEWITLERARIKVLWKNKWYKARVLESSGSRVKIHYDGYGSNWDEWITLDRVRSY